jgi:signal transduction histidine kinase
MGRRTADGGAELALTDSGPGFPEEHLSRLTDPFFTTREEGTGLGLPIAGSIIASHGGELILENAAEGGARARIVLGNFHE